MVPRLLVGALAALLVSSEVVAAESRVDAVQGAVVVIRDGRYSPSARSAVVRERDQIVSVGGEARIRYPDGCVAALPDRFMVEIGALSPCARPGNWGASPGAGKGILPVVGALATWKIIVIIIIILLLTTQEADGHEKPVSP